MGESNASGQALRLPLDGRRGDAVQDEDGGGSEPSTTLRGGQLPTVRGGPRPDWGHDERWAAVSWNKSLIGQNLR